MIVRVITPTGAVVGRADLTEAQFNSDTFIADEIGVTAIRHAYQMRWYYVDEDRRPIHEVDSQTYADMPSPLVERFVLSSDDARHLPGWRRVAPTPIVRIDESLR